jgi:hypothetical protein
MNLFVFIIFICNVNFVRHWINCKKKKQNGDKCNTIQLMTFDEVNTRIDQPMAHAIHRGIQVLYP